MSEPIEEMGLKVHYTATVNIIDKDTGREEIKVVKDGVLIEHTIIKEGINAAS